MRWRKRREDKRRLRQHQLDQQTGQRLSTSEKSCQWQARRRADKEEKEKLTVVNIERSCLEFC